MFENVNHPIKDGIIADNSTLSSRKIKEMVESATELPTPAAGDAGKALTVGDDLKYGLSAIPVELPTPAAGDNGKVLTVNSDLEYDLEAVPIPESGIINYTAVGVIVTDSTFNAVFALKPIDIKNALDAGKDVRLIANIVNTVPVTKDGKKVYFREGDLIVFKFMGKVSNGSGLDYSFRSVSVYNFPSSITDENIKGDLIMNFTNKLAGTSAGFQMNASYDFSKLETNT